jgi:signal transduction histidine kinase
MPTPAAQTREPDPERHLRIVRDSQAIPTRRLAALRVPLAVKLVGANALTLLLMASAWLFLDAGARPVSVIVLFVGLLAVHVMLTLIALRPVRDLEALASQVWQGDMGVRFRDSAVADDEVLRVGTMFNKLLDGLSSDRARMRSLAEEVVAVGDRERAALARELHDSTAQRLAALLLQISAAAREAREPDLAAKLGELRDATEHLTEEVRLLASSVHPRVLDDLGIVAAVKKLARDTTRASSVEVKVTAPDAIEIPHAIASVLYRVAQEAVRNAATHAFARSIRITLQTGEGVVAIEVADDGAGFDVTDAMRRRPGMGLFTMRERVSLVDGTFEIRSDSRGTTVAATVPIPDVQTPGEIDK